MKKIKFKYIMIAMAVFSLCCGISSTKLKGHIDTISATYMIADGFLIGFYINKKE